MFMGAIGERIWELTQGAEKYETSDRLRCPDIPSRCMFAGTKVKRYGSDFLITEHFQRRKLASDGKCVQW